MKREPKNPSRIINISDKEQKQTRKAGDASRSPQRSSAQTPRNTQLSSTGTARSTQRSSAGTARSTQRVSIENTRRLLEPEYISKKERKPLRILIPVVIGLIVVAVAVFIFIFLGIRKYPVNTAAYGISDEARLEAASNSNVLNIVFLGVDHQEDRSDVMMVISVDKKAKSVDVTSILRDTQVDIEGHAPTKLGYAYKWGGTDLALNTINVNFNTAFDRYICMTFEDIVSIVDAIGGVDIELTEAEAYEVNDLAQETGYMGWDAVAGWNTLNGSQALGYSRIRKIDSEYARAGRQQVVIKAIISKVKNMSIFKYPSVAAKVLKGLKTNCSYGELLTLALTGMKSGGFVKHTIPDANYEEGLFGGWVLNPDGGPEEDPVQWLWVYDLDAASYRLKRIMYDPDYWEDPDLPAKAWIWNELEDVIGGLDIDIDDIHVEDEIIFVEPETAANNETEEYTKETMPPESYSEEITTHEEPSSEEESTSMEESTQEETSEPETSDEEESSEETSEAESGGESESDEGDENPEEN